MIPPVVANAQGLAEQHNEYKKQLSTVTGNLTSVLLSIQKLQNTANKDDRLVNAVTHILSALAEMTKPDSGWQRVPPFTVKEDEQ